LKSSFHSLTLGGKGRGGWRWAGGKKIGGVKTVTSPIRRHGRPDPEISQTGGGVRVSAF